MAFATSNVRTSVFGNLRVTYGDWTGSVGDAAGTFNVGGGKVYFANFDPRLTTGPIQPITEVSTAVSGNMTTVTVYNLAAVTAGTFIIISA